MTVKDPFWSELIDSRGSRRDFLAYAAGMVAMGTLGARRADARLRTAAYPFSLGVASGDPTPGGVVLWTRLAPDPLAGGGMPASRVKVGWEVARDDGFRQIVKRGSSLALPELGHSVHVEVEGLEPARHYWYRFFSGGEASPIGRTRTAPAAGAAPGELNFAFASCQHYEQGYFTAHRHLSQEDLDLVVHLGDYIYEGGGQAGRARLHNAAEIVTLRDYRVRYGLYKSDPDLQASHAAFPFVVTWDDHEVENNYAGLMPEKPDEAGAFAQRRAAAYQAYYEHMPLRRSSMPQGPNLQLYRRLPYGGIAQFHMLDTRQYRTDQACGDNVRPGCAEAYSSAATITGAAQEKWLLQGLDQSRARWNILGNQLPIAPVDEIDGPQVGYSMDKWDGYVQSRRRLLHFLGTRRPSNPIVITGDVHVNWAAELKADPDRPNSETLGVEFVGTSITSGGDGGDMTRGGVSKLKENPHFKFFNGQRGYVRCKVTPERWTSDFRVLPYVTRPGAPISTRASLVVENGRPGIQQG